MPHLKRISREKAKRLFVEETRQESEIKRSQLEFLENQKMSKKRTEKLFKRLERMQPQITIKAKRITRFTDKNIRFLPLTSPPSKQKFTKRGRVN